MGRRRSKSLILLSLACFILGVNACLHTFTPTISLSALEETFGSPHIKQDNVCYYMGSWSPGGTLLKIHFSGDIVLKLESQRYNENKLRIYFPLLIESLQSTDIHIADNALRFLTSVMHQTYPNGYGIHYMTDDAYKDTPFEDFPPVWDTSTYKKWKDWWYQEILDPNFMRQ